MGPPIGSVIRVSTSWRITCRTVQVARTVCSMTDQVLPRWAPAVVGGLLALGGCGDGSSAVPPSMTTPLPAPTPVATDMAGQPLMPPKRPAAMEHGDTAGAQAAAEYFMELSGYAVRSQDLSAFTQLSDPECFYCDAVIDEVTADAAAGVYTIGGDTVFSVSTIDPPAQESFYIVWGTLDRTPFVAYDSSGKTIYESDGDSSLEFAVRLQHEVDGRWVVMGTQAGEERAS